MDPIDDDRLQRFFDRDLDEAEAAEVRQRLEGSPTEEARVAALGHLHRLLADEQLHPGLDARESDDLFERIQGSIGSPAAELEETAGPRLHAVDGGRQSEAPAPLESSGPPYRPEAWRLAIPAALALAAAAAVALWLGREGESTPPHEVVTRVETDVENTGLTLVEAPHGSEVVEVDFGENAGTVFEVEGAAGEPIAVVWITDDAWDEPREARQ